MRVVDTQYTKATVYMWDASSSAYKVESNIPYKVNTVGSSIIVTCELSGCSCLWEYRIIRCPSSHRGILL